MYIRKREKNTTARVSLWFFQERIRERERKHTSLIGGHAQSTLRVLPLDIGIYFPPYIASSKLGEHSCWKKYKNKFHYIRKKALAGLGCSCRLSIWTTCTQHSSKELLMGEMRPHSACCPVRSIRECCYCCCPVNVCEGGKSGGRTHSCMEKKEPAAQQREKRSSKEGGNK